MADEPTDPQAADLVDATLLGEDLAIPAHEEQTEPFALEAGSSAASPPRRLEIDREMVVSTKPFVGPLLTWARSALLRLLLIPLETWFREEANAREATWLAEAAARERAEAAIHGLQIEVDRLEKLADEAKAIHASIPAFETLVDQLELAQRVAAADERDRSRETSQSIDALAERLASLETTFEGLQLNVRSAEPGAALIPDLDYLAFERRFRPSGVVKERQGAYLDVLRGRRRVVDLGSGRGELLELLADADVPAYGVDIDLDLAGIVREKRLEIVTEDALAHLEALPRGAVDGIVASHLIEHLPAKDAVRLVSAAAQRLEPGGVLILETPNPGSIIAGSINFHRDPTHIRPVHPDTLAFLCETAGFAEVTVKRLSEVPEPEQLPRTNDETNPLAEHLDAVVDRLNDLLFGFQDYAVVAWK